MLRSCLHQAYIFQVPKPSAALQGRIGTIPTRDTESQAGIPMALKEDISEDEFCKQNLLSLHISYVGSRFFRFWCIETYQLHWEENSEGCRTRTWISFIVHPSIHQVVLEHLDSTWVCAKCWRYRGWTKAEWSLLAEVVVKSRWMLISNHTGNVNSQPSWELWEEGYGSEVHHYWGIWSSFGDEGRQKSLYIQAPF